MPEELGDDDKTIFSGDLNSDENEAVRAGEERGKKMAMLERPEHYGNIGSIARNRKAYIKNLALALGDCKICEHYNSQHNDVVGDHCRLPKEKRCVG